MGDMVTEQGLTCARCGEPVSIEIEGVPRPHAGKYVCKAGHFCGWVAQPMTFDRAASFVMPIGKHRGETIEQIGQHGGRDYLA